MKRGMYAVLVLLLLFSGGTLYALQLRLDIEKGEGTAAEEFMYLPKAEYLKVASLGYENLFADLLWLKAVQNMGERKISSQGYDWIYKALDTVTTLDPQYIEPYQVGGLILTVVADKADLSDKLLAKGVDNNPGVWELPFYLGFNNFFFHKDYKKAADYMAKAAAIHGSPDYLPLLASRLYAQAEDPAYALELLARMYNNSKNEFIRAEMLRRMNLLRAELDARSLQGAVDVYGAKFGRRPASLGELVVSGMVRSLPEEPNGGYYYIDAEGSVKSSKVKQEIGIYTRKR